jgi:GntR family transcriptional regulator
VFLDINPAADRPIYAQIVDEIERAIVMGSLQPLDPLPSVRQLAADLKLNPNTVKQAYRELERKGVAYAERGRGTFVAPQGAAELLKRRRSIARQVAERAVHDAYRHGLSLEDLIDAVESLRGRTRKRGGVT